MRNANIGSIAQLVQSTCLTSRGSQVRSLLLPHKERVAIFYILYSKAKDRYYIGYTTDVLEERIRRHNTNHQGFTGKTSDWQLVYSEVYSNKLQAHAREREVKRWKSRRLIEKLIQTNASKTR